MMAAHEKHLLASIQSELIAPCGMNCALCLAYLREKNRCAGCRVDDHAKRKSCAACSIRTCGQRQGGTGDYCFDCGTCPRAWLRLLDKRYRTKYSMSMPGNLACIRELGAEEFLRREGERWTCAGCGGVICVHRENCLYCGHPKERTPPNEEAPVLIETAGDRSSAPNN